MKEINNGEHIRRTKAVLAAPGVTLKDAAMAYGSLSGCGADRGQPHDLGGVAGPLADGL